MKSTRKGCRESSQMVSSRRRNIRTNGRGEKKKRKRGNERRNKVLACGGFTRDSMILRGLGGSIGPSGAQWGPLPSRRKSKRSVVAFYGVRPPFSMEIVFSPPRLRRIIDPDPIVFERESCTSALSSKRHTNLRTISDRSACRVEKNLKERI